MVKLFARVGSAVSTSDVLSYKAGEPLYELPGILHTSSWECFLDDLDGVDGQGEVGGDCEYSLVDRRSAGVWGRDVLFVPLRSHAFTYRQGKGQKRGFGGLGLTPSFPHWFSF